MKTDQRFLNRGKGGWWWSYTSHSLRLGCFICKMGKLYQPYLIAVCEDRSPWPQCSPEQGLLLSSTTAVSSSFGRMCLRNTWHVIFHLCGRARWEIWDGKGTLWNRTYFKFSCSSQIRSVFDFILFCLERNRDCKEQLPETRTGKEYQQQIVWSSHQGWRQGVCVRQRASMSECVFKSVCMSVCILECTYARVCGYECVGVSVCLSL